MKRYKDWAMTNISSLSTLDADEAEGLVQEAYHSAGGEVVVLVVLVGAAAYLIVDTVFARALETGISAGIFFGLFAVLSIAPADWYIKRRIAKRLADKPRQ